MKKYKELKKENILTEKAKGFFGSLNNFKYDKNLINFKEDIKEELVMSGQEISDDVASFLSFLIRHLKPKKILELGTFAGFSTLIIARNCPKDFQITTIDVNKDPALIGQKYWKKEGFNKRINFIQGRALEVIDSLDFNFDFIFIDADKRGTWNYLEKCLEKLEIGGVILVDNIWLNGGVLNPTREMHKDRIDFFKRVDKIKELNKNYIPIGDGLLIISKSK